jgi:hypothetical protein
MQLSITEDAEIFIIFDDLAGDILRGQGRGDLIIKSLRNGLFTINGYYEVEQGQYLFTLYNFVNKPFTIERGGTIVWNGDPLNANINLEAVYEGLSASPFPLIQYNLDENQKEVVKQQRTEVKVKMLLTGSLLQPTIKFDIEMPNLTGDIKSKVDLRLRELRDNEEQMNQQIFSLLVLRTFINTGNIGSEVTGNLGITAFNTLSEMLGNQLSMFVTNLLSNAFDDVDFISGVDFNIGYDVSKVSNETPNIKAGEVVVSVKPRLLNDKWIVTLGGNYNSNPGLSLYGNSYFNPESVIKLRVYYKAEESIEGVKHKIGSGINYRKEFDSYVDFEGELKNQLRKLKEKHDKKGK